MASKLVEVNLSIVLRGPQGRYRKSNMIFIINIDLRPIIIHYEINTSANTYALSLYGFETLALKQTSIYSAIATDILKLLNDKMISQNIFFFFFFFYCSGEL